MLSEKELTMLKKIQRYQEILTLFAKYGLADWLSQVDLSFLKGWKLTSQKENLIELSTAQRINRAFVELGPTFIKVGQILSTRADIVDEELAGELQALQSDIPPDSPEDVKNLLEEELKGDLTDHFSYFDVNPIGSASIGQVHLARLAKNGAEVVVKIQHKGIAEKIEMDLEILDDIAALLDHYVEEARSYRPIQIAEEFRRLILRELDFTYEARNLKKFAANFENSRVVVIPEVVEEICTSRVLTMGRIKGIPIANREELLAENYDLCQLAKDGTSTFLKMIFEDGFYHGDPHPGNIFIVEGQRIGLIDFGRVGHLGEEIREEIEDLLVGVTQRDTRRVLQILKRISHIPHDINYSDLESKISEFIELYTSLNISELNVQDILGEFSSIIRDYKIVLPSNLSTFIKVLIMLEGTSHSLDPNFNIMEVLQKYQTKAVWRRLSPERQKRIWGNFYRDLEKLLIDAPAGLADVMEYLKKGNFRVQLESGQLEHGVNRLVFGLITSALFIGSTLLMATKSEPQAFGISIPGAIGYIVSLGFGIRLLWAIYVSGNLSRGKR